MGSIRSCSFFYSVGINTSCRESSRQNVGHSLLIINGCFVISIIGFSPSRICSFHGYGSNGRLVSISVSGFAIVFGLRKCKGKGFFRNGNTFANFQILHQVAVCCCTRIVYFIFCKSSHTHGANQGCCQGNRGESF